MRLIFIILILKIFYNLKKMERKIKSLSWSKISSFLDFKNQFIKTYFEEEPFFETKEILFWKVMSAVLELNSFDFEEILSHLSKDRKGNEVPIEPWKIEIMRKSFENISQNEIFSENLINFQFNLFSEYEKYVQNFVEYKPAVDWVYTICCLWFLDNAKADLSVFREFKTWKKPWTQERADDHWQLYFYALLIESVTGKLPEKAYLDWIVTEDDEDWIVRPTGDIVTFEVKIKPEKVKELKDSLPWIFNDMQKAYEKWLQDAENNLEIETDIFEEYAEIEAEKKILEEKLKKLKSEINEKLKEKNLDSFKLEWVWSFYYTQRKSWIYDEKILKEEEKVKIAFEKKFEKIAEMKKEFEEKNEPIISSSLAFRAEKK